eukprot:scaffold286870_cov30-Tisochrysis_lutea.AAC.3
MHSPRAAAPIANVHQLLPAKSGASRRSIRTAAVDVPPRAKKLLEGPTDSGGKLSSASHAAATRRSVCVASPRPPTPTPTTLASRGGGSGRAERRSLPPGVSGNESIAMTRDGTMASGRRARMCNETAMAPPCAKESGLRGCRGRGRVQWEQSRDGRP